MTIIKVLFIDVSTRIKVNSFLSYFFIIIREVCQVFLLACYLFFIVDEIFNCIVKKKRVKERLAKIISLSIKEK